MTTLSLIPLTLSITILEVFAFSKLGSPNHDLESLQVCLWIGCTVVRRYLDLSRIRNPSSGDASSVGLFSRLLVK